MSEYTEKLFWAKVTKSDNCWEHSGTPSQLYPIVRIAGKNIKAHRFSYALANNGIHADEIIDHLCMNKKCVRPDHLESVSCKENLVRAHKSTHCSNCKCNEINSIHKNKPIRRKRNAVGLDLIEWFRNNYTEHKTCWLWNGATSHGYGSLYYAGKTSVVHRVYWELLYGPIAKQMDLHHKCEMRLCFNPDHLELMTRRNNLLEIWNRNHCAGCICQ